MNGHTNTFYAVSLTVLSLSAADVFIINTKPSETSPLSVSIDRSLQTFQELAGKRADEDKTLQVQLLPSNVQKPGKDGRNYFSLSSSRDLTKTYVADLLKILNSNKYSKRAIPKALPAQYRIFHNMYSVPKLHGYGVKKPKRPLVDGRAEKLQSYLKFLLSNTVPNVKYNFQDLTRFDTPNITEDYIDIGEIGRNKQIDRYSRDYIDLDSLRFRRNEYPIKAALRTYSVEGNDESSETNKLKRFEVIINKHNKNDIESSESDEVTYKKKKKALFKKKSNRNKKISIEDAGKIFKKKSNKKKISFEDAGTSLSSDEDVKSKERVRQKSKKRYQPIKKKRISLENDKSHEDDEPVGFYLQGNKLIMYPPIASDSSDENSDDNRRRGDRLPYFLPKRYHWNMDDIHHLGYFFFNGPKGVSMESEE